MIKGNTNTIQGNPSFQNRLTAYSTLAVAGACAVAAAPSSAQADIIYSGPLNLSVTVSSLGSYFNLTSFAFGASYTAVSGGSTTAPVLNLWGSSGSSPFSYLYPSATTVNRFEATTATSNVIKELALGDQIGITSPYTTSRTGATGGPVTNGGWTGETTGYFGIKFLNGTTTEYGWVQAFLPATISAADPIKILGAAYDNTGAAITAGAGAVPEPGTVGCLAAGVIGAASLAWRRRQVA